MPRSAAEFGHVGRVASRGTPLRPPRRALASDRRRRSLVREDDHDDLAFSTVLAPLLRWAARTDCAGMARQHKRRVGMMKTMRPGDRVLSGRSEATAPT